MDRCSSFTSHSFGKLRCFSIQKTSAEGFSSIGNPKLHPLRDLEVAQFVVSGKSDDASYVTGAELFVDGGFGQV